MNKLVKISVIISTYNPLFENLQQTLSGLKNQDLPLEEWECIIIDNASTNNTINSIDTGWHPNFKIIKEPKPGLTFARLRGYEAAKSDLLLFVDDDNILDQDYLTVCIALFKKYCGLGVIGGKSIGCFETEHDEWVKQFYSLIAVRPYPHPEVITNNLLNGYPVISPIGAGMGVRRECFTHYYKYINTGKNIVQDRTGDNLSSGGDNEINIMALKAGFGVGYFPELSLKHLINRQRLTVPYLKRLNYSSNRSWVKLLYAHGICPWRPISKISVPLRKTKAFFIYKPWRNPVNSINYSGACGMFKGLSELD